MGSVLFASCVLSQDHLVVKCSGWWNLATLTPAWAGGTRGHQSYEERNLSGFWLPVEVRAAKMRK